MFVESFTFSYEVGLFPRFAALVTICGTLLLLSKNYLPESVRTAVDDSGSVFDYEESDFVDVDGVDGDQQAGDESTETEAKTRSSSQQHTQETSDRDSSSQSSTMEPEARRMQTILVGLLLGYGAVGYVVGLVLATPLFVIAYAMAFSIRRRIALALLVIAIVIALAFNHILPVDLTRGGL
ncbi:hypothetical protein C493_18186 [Natronolimnohabitans innermongolicus JCM 12255]|uniref:DUF1468 domain-containing protein n=2 Tax=Natronolimnohabitans innermongolicus TaxID=253107 RepID=L9WP00_9EURY|nr:hypothetical protein C493_18186 [Natronolimnohabitans innermongolicus JCM 12255]